MKKKLWIGILLGLMLTLLFCSTAGANYPQTDMNGASFSSGNYTLSVQRYSCGTENHQDTSTWVKVDSSGSFTVKEGSGGNVVTFTGTVSWGCNICVSSTSASNIEFTFNSCKQHAVRITYNGIINMSLERRTDPFCDFDKLTGKCQNVPCNIALSQSAPSSATDSSTGISIAFSPKCTYMGSDSLCGAELGVSATISNFSAKVTGNEVVLTADLSVNCPFCGFLSAGMGNYVTFDDCDTETQTFSTGSGTVTVTRTPPGHTPSAGLCDQARPCANCTTYTFPAGAHNWVPAGAGLHKCGNAACTAGQSTVACTKVQSGGKYICPDCKQGLGAVCTSHVWQPVGNGSHKCATPDCNATAPCTPTGENTCASVARCSACGGAMGTLNPNNHALGGYNIYGADFNMHVMYCYGCQRVMGRPEPHTFENQRPAHLVQARDCDNGDIYSVACDVCPKLGKGLRVEKNNALGHNWRANGDGTHTCLRAGCDAANVPCSGGATCFGSGPCADCGQTYTDPDQHVWGPWQGDERVHWRACTNPACKGVRTENEGHTYAADSIRYTVAYGAESFTRCMDFTCDTCGQVHAELETQPYAEVTEASITTPASCTTDAVATIKGASPAGGEAAWTVVLPDTATGHAWLPGPGETHYCWNKGCTEKDIPCTGGDADCSVHTVCEVCGGLYFDPDIHDWDMTVYERSLHTHWRPCKNPHCANAARGYEADHRIDVSTLTPSIKTVDGRFYMQIAFTCLDCGWADHFAGPIHRDEMEVKIPATCTGDEVRWITLPIQLGDMEAAVDLTFEVTRLNTALGHLLGTVATCTTPAICIDCGESVIDPDWHEWVDEWSYDLEGHWRACANPDHPDAKDQAGAHDVEAGSVLHTVTIEGGTAHCYLRFTCLTCGRHKMEMAALAMQDLHLTCELQRNASCTRNMAYRYTQGERTWTIEVPDTALGHDWDRAATCLTPAKCLTCGETMLDENVHEFETAWTATTSHHWYACKNSACLGAKDYGPHSLDLDRVTTAAVAQGNIVRFYVDILCSACGAQTLDMGELTLAAVLEKSEVLQEANCVQPKIVRLTLDQPAPGIPGLLSWEVTLPGVVNDSHHYGPWLPLGNGRHRADCTRADCPAFSVMNCVPMAIPAAGEDAAVCLVCGSFGGRAMVRLSARAKALEEYAIPAVGELTAYRLDAPFDGAMMLLAVGYESGGSLIHPWGLIELQMELDGLQDFRLVWAEDGAELPFAYADGILTFQTDRAGALLLLPAAP